VALRFIGRTGARQDVTYAALSEQTNRFANALERLGVRKGEVVATLAGRIPALYVAALRAQLPHLEYVLLVREGSGTTGRPKGAQHVHEAVVVHDVTAWHALDLHPEDRFWCTADPGWVTGTSYGIIAPLVHGLASIVDEADFDAERWYRIVAERKSPSGTRLRPPSDAHEDGDRAGAEVRPDQPALSRQRR
jgi:acyl-coenzyme A synthetase/AMP-(fatty) acid ligase